MRYGRRGVFPNGSAAITTLPCSYLMYSRLFRQQCLGAQRSTLGFDHTKDESTTQTENEDGTIIRYDNFPDHPNAPIHHKHLPDGTVDPAEFTGVRPLFETFKIEVTEDYDEHWN